MGQLIRPNRRNRQKQWKIKIIQEKVQERIKNGIQQCSVCKNEFKKEELLKPSPNKPLSLGIWGFIYRIRFSENPESLMCVECDKKRLVKQNQFKKTFYLVVGIPIAILWIILIVQWLIR